MSLRRPWPGALAMAACIFWLAAAFALQPVPPLTGHVVDQTGTLSPAQAAGLEQALAAFEARKGSQLTVLVVQSTAPEDIAPYALRVAEQWKLGRKKIDDGALLVVALGDRALRIEVGYGLEGALNDLTCKRVIDEVILPRFKQGDFAGGIDAGVKQMLNLIDGEPLPGAAGKPGEFGGGVRGLSIVLSIAALAIGAVSRALIGKARGALLTGGAVGTLAWIMAGTLSIALPAALLAWLLAWLGPGPLLRTLAILPGGGGGRGGFKGGGGGFGGGGASGKW